MNVNLNLAMSATQWGHLAHTNKDAETTGAIANKNNNPIFKNRDAETTGAIAMFDGISQNNGGSFQAVA